MNPRLILLTGPAAGEVAEVFRMKCHDTERLREAGPLGEHIANAHPKNWDEVRDYREAARQITDAATDHANRAWAVEERIRSLPGGEEWLVGLVLPDPVYACGCSGPLWGNNVCRGAQPARLAILAPDPPPLLVERIGAWGGVEWFCREPWSSGQHPCIIVCGQHAAGGRTWPEAVRAALA